jgi:hypothetical protein
MIGNVRSDILVPEKYPPVFSERKAAWAAEPLPAVSETQNILIARNSEDF